MDFFLLHNRKSGRSRWGWPEQSVHHPWIELSKTSNFEWSLPKRDSYTDPHGGLKDIVHSADNLSLIFLAILPTLFFVKVAKMMRKYCYKDWVLEKVHRNEYGNEMNKGMYLTDVAPTTGGKPRTPGCRHHVDNEPVRWDVNPGFIICWIGILILQGGHFEKDVVGVPLWPEHTICEEFNATRCI
jgi:hypothetical protein